MSQEQARRKRLAAECAVADLCDGMTVGLGTGSTADLAIQALAERVRDGLRVIGVPTSQRSADLAGSLGIALREIGEVERIDVTIDGADEVDPTTLTVLKGRGGALVREKLVALASEREVIVVDDSKVVAVLGTRAPVPVEVVPFGWRVPARALARLGRSVTLRLAPDGAPYLTDNANYVLDVAVDPIPDPAGLAAEIKAITGVVDHGLFVGIAHAVYVGTADGVEVLRRAER
ncbi:MAG TPA: ribose-5-phosphate isomerase RpiA [Thermomicrobiaceae bacterium]|nr:ribose-5-phosphate isomerase RpiA [Thermomicrobiaceae bacterium]